MLYRTQATCYYALYIGVGDGIHIEHGGQKGKAP